MRPDGYVYSPNNIFPAIRENGGREVYPAGPFVWELPNIFIVADMGDTIDVFVKPYGPGMDLVKVLQFESADSFKRYCQDNGRQSEGGVYLDQGVSD